MRDEKIIDLVMWFWVLVIWSIPVGCLIALIVNLLKGV